MGQAQSLCIIPISLLYKDFDAATASYAVDKKRPFHMDLSES